MTDADMREVVSAIEARHRADMAAMAMKLAVYRAALEDAGVEPPTDDGAEYLRLWRQSAAVINTASRFVTELGTSKELLDMSGILGHTLRPEVPTGLSGHPASTDKLSPV